MSKWLMLFVQIFPTIVQLMGVAERAFGDKANSGADKKDMVMQATEAVIGGIAAVSTGGQGETWNRIKEPMSNIIDNAASIVFPHEEERRKAP